MIRLVITFFTLFYSLCGFVSSAQINNGLSQDSIIFQLKNRNDKFFSLPLNDYSVLLKPIEGKKKRVIITNYTDTTLTARVYSYKKGEERARKRNELIKLYNDISILNEKQIDSLAELIFYSDIETIPLREIDKIKISNRDRKEMSRVMSITDWSAASILVIGFPAALLFSAMLQSAGPYLIWNALTIGIVTVGVIIENKIIRLDKWDVVY